MNGTGNVEPGRCRHPNCLRQQRAVGFKITDGQPYHYVWSKQEGTASGSPFLTRDDTAEDCSGPASRFPVEVSWTGFVVDRWRDMRA